MIPTILIIDDDDKIRKMLSQILKQEGYNVADTHFYQFLLTEHVAFFTKT